MLLLVSTACACVFLVSGQENAQTRIPESLIECYRNQSLRHPENRPPMTIQTFIDIIRKVEKYQRGSLGIDALTTSLLHRWMVCLPMYPAVSHRHLAKSYRNLTVVQIAKKVPHIYGTQIFITGLIRAHHSPLSLVRLIQGTLFHYISLNFLILSPHSWLVLPSCLFDENHKSNYLCSQLIVSLLYTNYTKHVSAIRPSSGVSWHSRLPAYTCRRKTVHQIVKEPRIFEKRHLNKIFILYANH
jgi:hypothetical protein